MYESAAIVYGRAQYFVRAEHIHADGRADDIDDRIQSADLVKYDVLYRHIVNGGLRLRYNREYGYGHPFHIIVQRAFFDHGAYGREAAVLLIRMFAVRMFVVVLVRMRVTVVVCVIAVVGMIVSAVFVFMGIGFFARRRLAVYAHVEINARYCVHLPLARNEREARNAELTKFSAQLVRIDAQMYQRAESHVAADARYAIKV
jgi:hypothetical protein